MKEIFSYIKGDKVIWTIVLILSIISVLVVYTSTGTLAYKYQSGNTEYYLLKHVVILFLGVLIMYFAHKVKYTLYSRLSVIGILLTIPLLALTLAKGASLNEASRWLTLPGSSLTFQTSDLAKLALISYVARVLSLKQNNIKDLKAGFLPVVLPVLAICGLILPANFSTAAVLFSTCLVMMFIGRINLKYIFTLLGSGIVLFSLFIVIILNTDNHGRIGTWKKRIENFRNGESEGNYQVEQSKIAIATGGVLGKGPGKSTQRNYLPHPYSDFIYAIIIEEYGIVAGVVILFLYIILFFRTVRIASKSPKVFGSFLAIGFGFLLVFQGLINMAVAVNLFPVTGQPLPWLSMGGTSIWFTGAAIGIILSVSREIEDEIETINESGGVLATA